MNRVYYFLSSQKLSFVLVLLLFLVLLYAASLGQILRWDLSQQIAMADVFVETGRLYPDTANNIIGSASVYFPGVAFLAAGMIKLGAGEYIFEILLLIACLLFLYLVFLLSKVSNIFSKNEFSQSVLFSMFLAFTMFFGNYFWLYAIEFKPDTIAFCIGLSVLILAQSCDQKTFVKMFALGLFFSAGLLFKQQFLAGLVAILFFSLFIDRKWKFFGLGALVGTSLILFMFSQVPALTYWTIILLSDDGLLSIKDYVSANIDFYFMIVCLFAFVYIIGANRKYLEDKESFFWMMFLKIKSFMKEPIFWFLLSGAAAGLASSFKNGGNSGNSQIAIILLAPLFLSSTLWNSKLNSKILLAICIAFILPKSLNGVVQYSRASEEREYVQSIVSNIENPRIVFGSDLYFLIRGQTNTEYLVDYWTLVLESGMPRITALEDSVRTFRSDLLLVEPRLISRQEVENIENYAIIKANETLIFAVRVTD